MYTSFLNILLLLCYSVFSCTGSLNFQIADQFFSLTYSGLTEAEKSGILDFHNKIRAQTATGENDGQPPGKNIRKMVWSDKLQKLAQNWANIAPVGINPNLGKIGQNVDISSEWILPGQKKVLVQYCITWFKQKEYYTYSPMRYDMGMSSNPVTHYTQMVAANSYEIGCGFALFQLSYLPNLSKIIFICNYGPVSGNIIGKYPYEERKLNEPFCEGNLVDSDIKGLCDSKNAVQKSPDTWVIGFNKNDEDGCFVAFIMPLVKNLDNAKKINIKFYILKLIYGNQAPVRFY